jgi:hypothetical protein
MIGSNQLDTARERLLKMRDEELACMIRRGQLPRIDAINTALAALDEVPADCEPASHAEVSDDGKTTRLMLYVETGAVAAVELNPIRAIALARELIEAALPKLA